MSRHVVNLATRSIKRVELTTEETSARAAEEAAWVLAKNTKAASDGRAEAYAAARLAVLERIIDEELAKPESDLPEIEALRTALGGR